MNIFKDDVAKTMLRLDSESLKLLGYCINYAVTMRRSLEKVLTYKITQQDREAAKPLLHDGQRKSYSLDVAVLRQISNEARSLGMARDDYVNHYIHAAAPVILRACENACTLTVGKQVYQVGIDTVELHIKKLIAEKQNFSVKF